MTLIVFEIFTQSLVLGDTFSKGLYFRSATVVKKAKAIAKQNNWKKVKVEGYKFVWGEADDYGLLAGVYIIERTISEE